MRIFPVSAALTAALALTCGLAQAAGSVIVLQTPEAQATKLSQNGQYLAAFLNGTGGLRWDSATGTEEILASLVYVNGVNNLGTIAGAHLDNSEHELPATLPVGTTTPTVLPLPPGTDNADVYDVADDGTAVGLAWSDDWSVAKAYCYSPTDGIVSLPVNNTGYASRANSISADGRVIGGWNDTDIIRQGVVWIDHVPTYIEDEQGNPLDEASAVSGNGLWAVGSGWRMNVQTGEITQISSLPYAFGVSDDGKTIVGATGFFDYPPRALLLWTEENGTQQFSDYLTERGITWPAELETPWQGALSAISGDGKKAAGWLMTSSGAVSIVVDGLDLPPVNIYKDGFESPPVVRDGGFELTSGNGGVNPHWFSFDGNPESGGGTVFYTGGPTHEGGFAALFGGWGGNNAETQIMSQTVTVPSSAPQYLNFYRMLAMVPDPATTLVINIDGTAIQTIDLGTLEADEEFVQQSIDISSYADGGDHLLIFEFTYLGGGESDGALFIDDVSIDTTNAPARATTGKRVDRSALEALLRQRR